MTLGSEVHDDVVTGKGRFNCVAITDVTLNEFASAVGGFNKIANVLKVSCVGEFVVHRHAVIAVRE
jgi:hypothetical protein